MTDHVRIEVDETEAGMYPAGIAVGTLASRHRDGAGLPYLAALVNNDVASLSYPLMTNAAVSLLSAANPLGWRVYRRSLCFLLAKAVRDLFPRAIFSVEHSFGPGLYCSFQATPDRVRHGIAPDDLARLRQHMQTLVAADHPIVRRKYGYEETMARLQASGQEDKVRLLAFRNPPHVVMHSCEAFDDLAHGPLAPSTGVLGRFELLPYTDGFVLHLPERTNPTSIEPFIDQPHLFKIFQEHKEWGRILDVRMVGDLNARIDAGTMDAFIRIAEALHEKKLATIAATIAAAQGRIRLVLVAGPSAAGKTTFAQRLAIHLQADGLRPILISTDDYFVGPERNPRDEQGQLDFEHLEAIDLDLFQAHIRALTRGETIALPRFNFVAKRREDRGEKLRMADDNILIVEGIHGLNPRLTGIVPADMKFRVYVSALTQLAMDAHNRISTTDNRLMRRLVRDHRYRGHSALDTLRLWPSVRRGEKRWIFPYQQEADATFNSALDYELAVLKPIVEPLLMQVKPRHAEYAEARRLSEFLLNFLPASPEAVPSASILREYIGMRHQG